MVTEACGNVRKYFDGLCLDCMDYTQAKFADEDDDYWNHLVHGVQWDMNCRVKHGQATWYFSFSKSCSYLQQSTNTDKT